MSTLALGRHEGWDDVDVAHANDVCPVNDCGRSAKLRLMCSSHWRLVPGDARAALADARAALRRTRGAERHGAMARWDAAACRCIHSAEVHERG